MDGFKISFFGFSGMSKNSITAAEQITIVPAKWAAARGCWAVMLQKHILAIATCVAAVSGEIDDAVVGQKLDLFVKSLIAEGERDIERDAELPDVDDLCQRLAKFDGKFVGFDRIAASVVDRFAPAALAAAG
jgi:hypothetical protein